MERLGWATVGAVFGGAAVWAASRFIGSGTRSVGKDAPQLPKKHAKEGESSPVLSGATAGLPRSSHQPNEGSVQTGTQGPMGGKSSEVGSGVGLGTLPAPTPRPLPK